MKTMESIKTRETYLDTICGILIVYMIFYHCIQHAGLTTNKGFLYIENIFSFFMPWFFFKSGMFIKGNLYSVFKKGLKRLIKPFIVFTLIGHLVHCIFYFFNGDYNWIHYTLSPLKSILLNEADGWSSPLWFLLTLYFAQLVVVGLQRTHIPKLVIPVVALILSVAFHYFAPIYPIIINNIFSAIFFLSIGHILKDLQFNKWIEITCILVYIAVIFLNPSFVDMKTNTVIYGNYLIWILCAIAGIICWNTIVKRIIPDNVVILSAIGRNSLYYYCLHWIIIKCVIESFNVNNSYLLVCILTIANIVLLFALKKVFYYPGIRRITGL